MTAEVRPARVVPCFRSLVFLCVGFTLCSWHFVIHCCSHSHLFFLITSLVACSDFSLARWRRLSFRQHVASEFFVHQRDCAFAPVSVSPLRGCALISHSTTAQLRFKLCHVCVLPEVGGFSFSSKLLFFKLVFARAPWRVSPRAPPSRCEGQLCSYQTRVRAESTRRGRRGYAHLLDLAWVRPCVGPTLRGLLFFKLDFARACGRGAPELPHKL